MLIAANPGPQSIALAALHCPWLFYGGARGGGKTYFLILDWLQSALVYGDSWHGVIFRKTYAELEDVVRKANDILIPLGARYNGSSKTYRLPNGATLKLRYIRRLDDAENYQGHEYQWIGIDEIGNFPHADILERIWMSSRTSKVAGLPRRMRLTGNPGGVGHGWLRRMFIDHAPPFTQKDGRMFIPSLVTDNIKLMRTDPKYYEQLMSIENPMLRAAWLEGRWDIQAGQYFPTFDPSAVQIRLPEIPQDWPKFCGYDHGTASPYALVICAISNGSHSVSRGTVVVLGEVYGGKDGRGFRHDLAKMANKMIYHLKLCGAQDAPIYYDPSIKNFQGGPSIVEQLISHGMTNMIPGDNNRKAGWLQLQQRITDNTIKFVECQTEHAMRGIVDAAIDIDNPEDVDTTGDDHMLDALRYALMSRPWATDLTQVLDKNVLTRRYLDKMIKSDIVYGEV